MTLHNGGKEPGGSVWEATNSESAGEVNLYYPFERKILNSVQLANQQCGFKEFCLSDKFNMFVIFLYLTYFWSKFCFILFWGNLSSFLQSSII